MAAPQSIVELVEKFRAGADRYRKADYNETQVRVEFVNPLFEALGWDVRNSEQVTHEDRVLIEGQVKHPDYGFRLGRETAFYVETKKPSVSLRDSIVSAEQLRGYGWSGNTDVGILTDFEEFVVYDCRIEPRPGDPTSEARVWYLNFEDYVTQWDEIASYFSAEAVTEGKHKSILKDEKRGTTRVDEAFLRDMEGWREKLAKDMHLHNRNLTHRELNHLVQTTIDRIVFLRIAEDRNIENFGRLRRASTAQKDVYEELKILFKEADDKYNSGLFHFDSKDKARGEADHLSMSITLSDAVLREIIGAMYYPKSLYQFSVIPADILGQVYERFLGKVIVLSEGGQAEVEEKPEVRKAGGVYYTPTYIVDYIVENTVGKLVAGKTPGQVEKLTVLDPACGSGSFLIGAYQYLMDWHLDYYQARIAETPNSTFKSRVKTIPDDPAGGMTLNTDEKRRILLNNIYGVDLDQSAVEVTKLSLLLKMLENETGQTATQSTMFSAGERILPDLSQNIKWGNSLIGSDFYRGKQLGMFDDEEMYRVKAFDWDNKRTGFGDILAKGGFDAVIGNPPYVRQETLGKDFKGYAKQKYETYSGTADLYAYFIEKGVTLLNEYGLYGVIVANKWMRANYGKKLRLWLKERNIAEIIDFGDLPVFKDVSTYPCIITVSNVDEQNHEFFASIVENLSFDSLVSYVNQSKFPVNQQDLNDEGWSLVDKTIQSLLKQVAAKGVVLDNYDNDAEIYRGIITGLNEAFVVDEDTKIRLIEEHHSSKSIIKPFLAGRDIKKYIKPTTDRYVIIIPSGWTKKHLNGNQDAWEVVKQTYPAVAKHLEPFKEKAEKRWDKGDYWWELRPCDYYDKFEQPKIIFPDISREGNFTLDVEGKSYSTNTTYFISTDDKYLLALLNSKLLKFIYTNMFSVYRGGYLRFFTQYLEQLPIRTIDFDNPTDKAKHDQMVSLVETMLALHKQLPDLTGIARETVEAQIEATDSAIDQLVYELYGLTDDEIAIVEGDA